MKPFGLPIGITMTFWGIIGLVRVITEKFRLFSRPKPAHPRFKKKDLAVLFPAHNEEMVIEDSIASLRESLPADQIYVVSDGSVDRTYELARKQGCHAVQLIPGQGKAKALIHLMRHFNLYQKYKLIFIVDADTKIDKHFVENALPIFDDPEIAVVFGSPRILWPRHIIPRDNLHIIAYREKLNRMLQYFLTYGQTWKYCSMNYVIPGFATIYRSEILQQIELDAPGLLIEDFNAAFQLHKKKLGKIGFHPSLIGWVQHPNTLRDYWGQVRRWNIGFFQTVRKNGIWPSFFWLFLWVFSVEVFLNSLFILSFPVLIPYLLLSGNQIVISQALPFVNFYRLFGPFQNVTLWDIILVQFIIDYFFTVLIGLINKKPQFIFYGLFFFFMHYVTALILVTSLIPGFFQSSQGRWVSPSRRRLD